MTLAYYSLSLIFANYSNINTLSDMPSRSALTATVGAPPPLPATIFWQHVPGISGLNCSRFACRHHYRNIYLKLYCNKLKLLYNLMLDNCDDHVPSLKLKLLSYYSAPPLKLKKYLPIIPAPPPKIKTTCLLCQHYSQC